MPMALTALLVRAIGAGWRTPESVRVTR